MAFLRVAFFLVAFLRVAFFLVAFLRVAFLRVAFLRVAFLRVAFLRVAFLRVAFFLVAFLRVAFFLVAFFLAIKLTSMQIRSGPASSRRTGCTYTRANPLQHVLPVSDAELKSLDRNKVFLHHSRVTS